MRDGKMCKIGFFGYATDFVEYHQHKRPIKLGKNILDLLNGYHMHRNIIYCTLMAFKLQIKSRYLGAVHITICQLLCSPDITQNYAD